MSKINYDEREDEMIFPDGRRVYSFGGNPSIAMDMAETMHYAYGSDGGFYVEDIGLDNAILMAEEMMETWRKHKLYLEAKRRNLDVSATPASSNPPPTDSRSTPTDSSATD